MSKLKKDKGTEYIITWKSKQLFKSNLEPLFNPFTPIINELNVKYEYKSLTVT